MLKSSNSENPKMITTVMILDLLKEKLGSDYKTSKLLDVQTTRITKLRHSGGVITDEQGLIAAETLGFPPEWILVSLAAERALNKPTFGILTHLADKLDTRKVGAVAFLLLLPIASLMQTLPLV